MLFKDNEESGVRIGAEFLDVDGFFSTLNMIHVSVAIEIGFMITMGYALHRIAKHYNAFLTPVRKDKKEDYALNLRRPIRAAVFFLVVDLVFFLGVITKDHVFVSPNEPSIQIPFIQRHMDATLTGYRLNDIETVDWRPPEAPLSPDKLLASKTVQNAPIFTPFVTYMEEPPDVQHFERIQASESLMVFGPMLDIFKQEQQLRPYYQILNVDGVRYTVDGEKKMYVSATRELPSLAFLGPKEWLRYWGSAALMFTHGLGLVMAPVNIPNEEGGPVYVSHEVPPKVENPAFEAEPRLYFGEGMKDDYILTNIRHLKELDHATRQFREEFVFPDDIRQGIPVDSFWKRLILAFHTKDLTAFLFSDFIDHSQTRIHLYRTPLRRAARIAPFLFLDTNNYAFVADKKILWMVNALTTTDQYPYSYREALGDKADERAIEKFPERVINYAEDSVKVTIDAYTGEAHFYKIANDPIVNAWDKIYPGLFEDGSGMPKAVKAQLTYPLQWFHIQFDDIYKRYHQLNPIEFYNVEDLWDDADEVLGSIGRGLTEFGTTDQMTFSYEGTNLLIDPADLPRGTNVGTAGELQFTMLMPFTCEGCRNLRSLILAFQDPDTYGKLVNLRIPQGTFVAGPEQVDTYIDDDAQANQQITMWVRHGSEVVRGHTLILPVQGDVMYVEPLYIVSLQNPLPEIKLYSVVYRGRTTMATSFEKAIRLQAIPEAAEQQMNMLPWFEEDKRRDQ